MTLILGLLITATFSIYLTLTFAQQNGRFAKSSGTVNNLNIMWLIDSKKKAALAVVFNLAGLPNGVNTLQLLQVITPVRRKWFFKSNIF